MKIKHKGYIVVQADNFHITLAKDRKLKWHAVYDKKLSESELRAYADDVIDFITDDLVEHLKWDAERRDNE